MRGVHVVHTCGATVDLKCMPAMETARFNTTVRRGQVGVTKKVVSTEQKVAECL